MCNKCISLSQKSGPARTAFVLKNRRPQHLFYIASTTLAISKVSTTGLIR